MGFLRLVFIMKKLAGNIVKMKRDLLFWDLHFYVPGQCARIYENIVSYFQSFHFFWFTFQYNYVPVFFTISGKNCPKLNWTI